GKNRLFGALLEDAKLGAALEFPHFGPGVLDGPGGHASEQQGKDSKHVLSECTTPTSPGSKGRVHTINRCVGGRTTTDESGLWGGPPCRLRARLWTEAGRGQAAAQGAAHKPLFDKVWTRALRACATRQAGACWPPSRQMHNVLARVLEGQHHQHV